jgi:hypothetical protein
MKLRREHDILIAQTMAFVQSVTGETTEAEGEIEPISLDEPAKVERPVETVAIARPTPFVTVSFATKSREGWQRSAPTRSSSIVAEMNIATPSWRRFAFQRNAPPLPGTINRPNVDLIIF